MPFKTEFQNKFFLNALENSVQKILLDILNPLTPMGDQDRISPYNFDTIPSRHVMRIKNNLN